MNEFKGTFVFLLVITYVVGCNESHKEGFFFLNSERVLQGTLPNISKTHTKKLQIERIKLRKQDWEIIGKLKNLEYLRLTRCEVGDDDLVCLSRLSKLERLTIGPSTITDEGLVHLGKLPHLRRLQLNSPHLTGTGFSSFEHPDSIESLMLDGCPIDDAGTVQIARFRNLRTIFLRSTEVTDEGLMHLSSNYFLLNILPSPRMTDEGMMKFRNALLNGRRNARKAGQFVPPDDTLFIQTENPKVRGASVPPGYADSLDSAQNR